MQALRVRASLDSAPLPASLEGSTAAVPYDWSLFQVRELRRVRAPLTSPQGALRLVHVTSNLTTRLIQFDKSLRRILVEQRAQIFGANCTTDFRDQTINKRCACTLCPRALTHCVGSFVERHMSQFSITDDDPERVAALLTFMLSVSVDGPRRVLQPAVAQAMTLQSTAHGFAFDSVFQFVRGILGVFHTLKVRAQVGSLSDVHTVNRYGTHRRIQQTSTRLSRSPPAWAAPRRCRTSRRSATTCGRSVCSTSTPRAVVESASPRHHQAALWTIQKTSSPAVRPTARASAAWPRSGWPLLPRRPCRSVRRHATPRMTHRPLLADIQRILELKELSAAGAKQLATDISYLCNFLTGLSIPHDPALVRLLELLPLSPAECVSLVASRAVLTLAQVEGSAALHRRQAADDHRVLRRNTLCKASHRSAQHTSYAEVKDNVDCDRVGLVMRLYDGNNT